MDEALPKAEQQTEATRSPETIETPEAVEARRNEVVAKVDGVLMKLEGNKDPAADAIQLKILQDPPTPKFLEERDKSRLDQFRETTKNAIQQLKLAA